MYKVFVFLFLHEHCGNRGSANSQDPLQAAANFSAEGKIANIFGFMGQMLSV